MANLRVVYNNCADRATLAATAGVGALVAANLLTDIKSEVWRTGGSFGSITLTWPTSEVIGCVALPFCSLSETAVMRVTGFAEVGDTSPIIDTGTFLACPASVNAWGWSESSPGVNSYAYAGASYAIAWFAQRSVKRIVVDILDDARPYVEVSRVVAGAYWSPTHNAEYGVQVSMGDTSKHERSDAGDLRTERGFSYKKISLDLNQMPSSDRATMWDIYRRNGMSKPLFFSLTPQSLDAGEEQTFSLYGKLSQQSSIRYQFANQYNTSIELEEI